MIVSLKSCRDHALFMKFERIKFFFLCSCDDMIEKYGLHKRLQVNFFENFLIHENVRIKRIVNFIDKWLMIFVILSVDMYNDYDDDFYCGWCNKNKIYLKYGMSIIFFYSLLWWFSEILKGDKLICNCLKLLIFDSWKLLL